MSCIKIYFDDKPLFACENIPQELEKYRHDPHTLWLNTKDEKALKSLFKDMKEATYHRAVLSGDFLKNIKKVLLKEFQLVEAGGGIVQNPMGEILLIFRRGKWDLPKGKLDKGESIQECALREVSEETGLNDLKLINPFTITYHTYKEKGKLILKESHWFLMEYHGNETPVPQLEEQITLIKWVAKKDLSIYFSETFVAVRDILQSLHH